MLLMAYQFSIQVEELVFVVFAFFNSSTISHFCFSPLIVMNWFFYISSGHRHTNDCSDFKLIGQKPICFLRSTWQQFEIVPMILVPVCSSVLKNELISGKVVWISSKIKVEHLWPNRLDNTIKRSFGDCRNGRHPPVSCTMPTAQSLSLSHTHTTTTTTHMWWSIQHKCEEIIRMSTWGNQLVN
jgi:hypothetical protein